MKKSRPAITALALTMSAVTVTNAHGLHWYQWAIWFAGMVAAVVVTIRRQRA